MPTHVPGGFITTDTEAADAILAQAQSLHAELEKWWGQATPGEIERMILHGMRDAFVVGISRARAIYADVAKERTAGLVDGIQKIIADAFRS
jgi:hypothetical protein